MAEIELSTCRLGQRLWVAGGRIGRYIQGDKSVARNYHVVYFEDEKLYFGYNSDGTSVVFGKSSSNYVTMICPYVPEVDDEWVMAYDIKVMWG